MFEDLIGAENTEICAECVHYGKTTLDGPICRNVTPGREPVPTYPDNSCGDFTPYPILEMVN